MITKLLIILTIMIIMGGGFALVFILDKIAEEIGK
jgi:hypothetical protein